MTKTKCLRFGLPKCWGYIPARAKRVGRKRKFCRPYCRRRYHRERFVARQSVSPRAWEARQKALQRADDAVVRLVRKALFKTIDSYRAREPRSRRPKWFSELKDASSKLFATYALYDCLRKMGRLDEEQETRARKELARAVRQFAKLCEGMRGRLIRSARHELCPVCKKLTAAQIPSHICDACRRRLVVNEKDRDRRRVGMLAELSAIFRKHAKDEIERLEGR